MVALHTEQNTDELKAGLARNTEITQAVHVNTRLIHLVALRVGITEAEIKSALEQPDAELCR